MGSHASAELGDFTATWRVLPISALAIAIGVVAAFVAKALLALIALCTNLFYYQRFSFAASSPANHTLGYLAIGVPVIGALIIGAMARYGSERIRGHGIPDGARRRSSSAAAGSSRRSRCSSRSRVRSRSARVARSVPRARSS